MLDEPYDVFVSDFGTDARLVTAAGGATAVRGILDRPYAEADVGGVGIEATEITFTAATDDMPDIAEGDTLEIALEAHQTATVYSIRDLQADGTGMTTLTLQETV